MIRCLSKIAPEYSIGGSQFVENSVFAKKVLVLNPYPQAPFPGKGAECGAAALTPLGATPQTPIFNN